MSKGVVMKLRELFEKDINRNINGVVKVEQVDDEAIIYQELDEFVVTKELSKHFSTFYSNYESISKPQMSSCSPVFIIFSESFLLIPSLIYLETTCFKTDPSPHEFSRNFCPNKPFLYSMISNNLLTLSSGVKI